MVCPFFIFYIQKFLIRIAPFSERVQWGLFYFPSNAFLTNFFRLVFATRVFVFLIASEARYLPFIRRFAVGSFANFPQISVREPQIDSAKYDNRCVHFHSTYCTWPLGVALSLMYWLLGRYVYPCHGVERDLNSMFG